MKDNQDRLPDLILEKYALGELKKSKYNKVKKRVETNPEDQRRLAELEQSNREILEKYPVSDFTAKILARAGNSIKTASPKQEPSKIWPRLFLYAPTVALAAILLFVISPFNRSLHPVNNDPDGIRFKGSNLPQLIVYRKTGTSFERLSNGSTASKEQIIQLGYLANGKSHGVILSIDGRSSVTLHFPESENGSTALSGQKEVLLPFSYELDDAPGFERFFFITSNQPIDTGLVLQAARTLANGNLNAISGSLDLPKTLEQTSFVLKKVR